MSRTPAGGTWKDEVTADTAVIFVSETIKEWQHIRSMLSSCLRLFSMAVLGGTHCSWQGHVRTKEGRSDVLERGTCNIFGQTVSWTLLAILDSQMVVTHTRSIYCRFDPQKATPHNSRNRTSSERLRMLTHEPVTENSLQAKNVTFYLGISPDQIQYPNSNPLSCVSGGGF
jgi:hypothetical protein